MSFARAKLYEAGGDVIDVDIDRIKDCLLA